MSVPEPQEGVGVPDAFARLYTPHRMAYIKGEGKGGGCPFCSIPDLSDEDGLIVARGELAYAVLNLYPYNSGHLMLVPFRHVASYDELTSAEAGEVGELVTGDAGTLVGRGGARRGLARRRGVC